VVFCSSLFVFLSYFFFNLRLLITTLVSSSFFLNQKSLGTDHLTCRGGYGFLIRSEFFFRTTHELEFFFPEFNIRLYDNNSESDKKNFLHQNQNIFFSNIGNQNIFLEKYHNPPFPHPCMVLTTFVQIHIGNIISCKTMLYPPFCAKNILVRPWSFIFSPCRALILYFIIGFRSDIKKLLTCTDMNIKERCTLLIRLYQ
jgi:hypothetical protein